MKIILSGGTGFIGEALLEKLSVEGHEVILLSRSQKNASALSGAKIHTVAWDARSEGDWMQHVNGADAVINLAGEPIAGGRWTETQKEKILKSRVDSTRILVQAIIQSTAKPRVLVNASAVGYYGNVPSGDVTEAHPKGSGFLAETCDKWEKEALLAEGHGVRVALIRTGIVLEQGGGALAKILPPFKMFIGGPLGSGDQWFPWVDREDEAGAILFALKTEAITGPVNVAAPDPVTMKEFCRALGRAMHRPSWAPVPAIVLRTLLGEMADLLLEGQKVIPEKLLKFGFNFRFPKLQPALEDILR